MGSVSINFQVRSFCNYCSIPPHLDDSPFFSFVCSTFFSSHACSLCLVNIFSFSFYSISSSTPLIGLSWTNRNSSPRLHPLLGAPDHDLLRGWLGSARNAPSVSHLPPWTTVYTRSYSNSHLKCRRPCYTRALPQWTTSSSSNVNKAALRRRFLFDGSNQRNPLLQSLPTPVSASTPSLRASSFYFSKGDDQGNDASTPPYPLSWTQQL